MGLHLAHCWTANRCTVSSISTSTASRQASKPLCPASLIYIACDPSHAFCSSGTTVKLLYLITLCPLYFLYSCFQCNSFLLPFLNSGFTEKSTFPASLVSLQLHTSSLEEIYCSWQSRWSIGDDQIHLHICKFEETCALSKCWTVIGAACSLVPPLHLYVNIDSSLITFGYNVMPPWIASNAMHFDLQWYSPFSSFRIPDFLWL